MSVKLASRLVPILALFVLTVVYGSQPVRAAELQLSDVPAVSSQAPASPDVPAEGPDLFTPKPIFLCKSGWCSTTAQCQDWFGPDWVCHLGSGQTCGICQLEA